jgi:hypothetical protein
VAERLNGYEGEFETDEAVTFGDLRGVQPCLFFGSKRYLRAFGGQKLHSFGQVLVRRSMHCRLAILALRFAPFSATQFETQAYR